MKNYKVVNNIERGIFVHFIHNEKGEINFACDEEALKLIYHEKISTEEGLKEWNKNGEAEELIIEMEGVEEIKKNDFKYFITFSNKDDEDGRSYVVYSDYERELEGVIETLNVIGIGTDEDWNTEDEDGNPYITIYSSKQF